MNICLICKEDKSDYTTSCGHEFHKDCFTKWLEFNETCPHCNDPIDFDKRSGERVFLTRCHHVILFKTGPKAKRRYHKCPDCNLRISKSQRKELINSRQAWTYSELDILSLLSLLDLTVLLCKNPEFMDKLSLSYLLKLLVGTGYYLDGIVYSGLSMNLMNYACKGNNLEAIKVLLKLGSNPNFTINQPYSPVMFAIKSNDLDLLNLLIEYPMDIPKKYPKILPEALSCLEVDEDKIFERLVQLGLNPKISFDGITNLLLEAARRRHYKALIKLIDVYNLDVNDINVCRDTLFLEAYLIKDPKVIDSLVQRGANIRHKNCFGFDAFQKILMFSSSYYYEPTLDNEIMFKIYDIMQPNLKEVVMQEMTPLSYVASKGNLDFLNFFISKGANIRQPSKSGSIPLYFAIENRRQNIVKRLMELGCELNEKPTESIVPLIHHFAMNAFFNDFLLFKELHELGGDFNSRTITGKTALHSAAECGNFRLIVELVKVYGADVNAVDNYGKLPIEYALNDKISEKLLELGSKSSKKWYHIFTSCMNYPE